MITTIIILLSITCLVLGYVTLNLYYKLTKYESFINGSREFYDSSYILLERLLKLFVEAKAQLTKVDAKGSFSTDDEVGFVFKLINSVIVEITSKLNEVIEIINNEETESKGK